ncbi:MAG: prepilin-type N-terminal cleavage/methylation domain-containing protein [Desulfobacteraceae bacterium]|nr:prepilin-type N-terminal cleavage/methylation domain-containing protein [Desulfobacteraceae bacterium]MCB9494618.1 prepilin-type N-terminal cleavage/methylation domain-containing protein [Desulfobacteraceae bacterium]
MNEKGFTLIEVMMALVMFSMGISAVLTLQVSAVKTNLSSYYLQGASNALNNSIERIIDNEYDKVTSDESGIADFSNPVFLTSWKVTEDFPEENIKKIDIAVKWTKGSKDHHIDYTFYKKKF